MRKSENPASQAILNSARCKDSETPEKPYTPKRREGIRRARPSASHVQGRFAQTQAAASISPSAAAGSSRTVAAAGRLRSTESPSATRAPNRLEDLAYEPPLPVNGDLNDMRSTSNESAALEGEAANRDRSSFFGVAPDRSHRATGIPQTLAEAEGVATLDIPLYTEPDSDSDVDELAASLSPPPPPLIQAVSPEDMMLQEQELLLEMTMEDSIPASQFIVTQATKMSKAAPPLLETSSHDEISPILPTSLPQKPSRTPSASPMLPTPPDGILPARQKADVRHAESMRIPPLLDARGVVPTHFNPENVSASLQIPKSEDLDRSSDSGMDSSSPSPMRRRDIIIISENKTRKRKHERQPIKKDETPDLLFSSADSGASVEPDARQVTPVGLMKPTKKGGARKVG